MNRIWTGWLLEPTVQTKEFKVIIRNELFTLLDTYTSFNFQYFELCERTVLSNGPR